MSEEITGSARHEVYDGHWIRHSWIYETVGYIAMPGTGLIGSNPPRVAHGVMDLNTGFKIIAALVLRANLALLGLIPKRRSNTTSSTCWTLLFSHFDSQNTPLQGCHSRMTGFHLLAAGAFHPSKRCKREFPAFAKRNEVIKQGYHHLRSEEHTHTRLQSSTVDHHR